MIGFWGLFQKEVLRFWRVFSQTVGAPVLTILLYLMVFSHILDRHREIYAGVSFVEFMLPGFVMMSVLQNSVANSSSSLIQSKVTGNIILILLPPISAFAFFAAYIAAATVRALAVGAGVLIAGIFFVPSLQIESPLLILFFAVCGGVIGGSLGVIAGLWAERFDQMAMFNNFVILPLTFLSGVFYSIHSLPDIWQTLSKFNPFFYMIDGFRYGFFAAADVHPALSLSITALATLLFSLWAFYLIRIGYKIRS